MHTHKIEISYIYTVKSRGDFTLEKWKSDQTSIKSCTQTAYLWCSYRDLHIIYPYVIDTVKHMTEPIPNEYLYRKWESVIFRKDRMDTIRRSQCLQHEGKSGTRSVRERHWVTVRNRQMTRRPSLILIRLVKGVAMVSCPLEMRSIRNSMT